MTRFHAMSRHTDAILAAGIVGLVLLLIIPLPACMLDVFLCFNIIISVMVLLLTLYIESALEFSSFPTLLLLLTLFRLGLNIASTRMILSEAEAGDIIKTFGEFVIQDSEIVGLILFILLTVINFVVVTKGAGRIAEVSARFTLEALPGKQMAIDSELSTGLISQKQAQDERKKISAEADFYGAMDGASKFVKGDAITGVIITGINIVGGLLIGYAIKGFTWRECWSTMTRLTIGDGLVTQIPALLVSVGAAVMVTRASSGSLGQVLLQQIFHHPKVLMLAASLLILISFIPGMPLWLMLPLGGTLFVLGLLQKKNDVKNHHTTEKKEYISFLISPLEIQLGYQAVYLVEPLQERIKEIREKVAARLGLRIPSIHIADQVDLPPAGWAILVKGVKVASGRDPEIGLISKCLTEVVYSHSHELINRQDVAQLLQEVKTYDGAVVDELFPKKLSLGQIVKVLQQLLKEQVPIRDFVTILEILADHASGEKSDLNELVEKVRQGMAGKISEEIFGKHKKAHVITLDPKIEQMVHASKGNLRPKAVDQIAKEIFQFQEHAGKMGVKPVILTVSTLRPQIKRLIEKKFPDVPVLSYHEISSDIELSSLGVVSTEVLL